jgi:hypothetical protein
MNPTELQGWFVTEAGVRQAWPFLNLCQPASNREVRLYIDTDFEVGVSGEGVGGLVDELASSAARLAMVLNSTVDGVTLLDDDTLELRFGDEQRLRISGEPNATTTSEPWRLADLSG